VQPTLRPSGNNLTGGAVFGIIIAITFGSVILVLVIVYLFKCREGRRVARADGVEAPAYNPESREISFATISANNPRQQQTFPASFPPQAPAVYPVANVDLAARPVGSPVYQEPGPATLPPSPAKSPSEHDFDM
jgi:hypothetical protein